MSDKMLHVEIDPSAGFCFGVAAAVKMAENALDKGLVIHCLGELLHNEAESNRLKQKGMLVIGSEDMTHLRGQAVLFRAHGEPPESFIMARNTGVELLDATCPVVRKLQNKVREDYRRGAFIIILGKPDHPEVVGINGNIGNKALVVQSYKDLIAHELPDEVVVYSQTTMDEKILDELVDFLKSLNRKVQVNNTICRQVSQRIPLLEGFAAAHDVILFVGGSNSSNSRQLFEVCQRINKRTYFISSVSGIQKNWIRSGDSIGITGGTSTPGWLMEKVKTALLT